MKMEKNYPFPIGTEKEDYQARKIGCNIVSQLK